MAYNTVITCTACGENKNVIVPSSGPRTSRCHDCEAAYNAEQRANYFAELDNLTLEERVRRIEEWIYEYKPTYVEPPRF